MEQKKEIKLKISDEQLKGIYANQIAVMHSKYEFVVDFVSLFPPEAIVGARVITNPAALKQMYLTLGLNIKKYEEKFGEISMNEEDSQITQRIN